MMNTRSSLLITMIILLSAVCQAQYLNDKILMTIAGNKIQAGEFIRMWKKSTEPGAKMDVDSYLRDYIIFKLKVADALSEGLDTTRAFRNELNGYRNQLAQNYLTDTQTRERVLEKAYERSLTEVNAWHIRVELPQDASAADTLLAWEKAYDIRERIIKGESFEVVARATSDDQSVKFTGGNLGYFTVFQMIMPFEDAVYTLKKGAISMPVRTPYGYHIIKVTDKRPSRGKIKVAHIMKTASPGTSEEEAKRAEEDINKLYVLIQQGKPFSEVAKMYSDHKESAVKGGELNWFGAGEIISDFSEAAFSIKDTGSYTKPVRTLYGWHIIKLFDRKPPGSFEESKSYLESKINQSYLNSLNRKSLVDKLKKEYKFRINQDAFTWFVQNTDTLIIQGVKKYNRTGMPAGDLYSFANQSFTTRDFATYIEKRGTMVVTTDSTVFINRSIEAVASDQIINYENSVLERKYPEFRYLMNEFHDGILLFEISGEKVWNKVSEDTNGLQDYYQAHKDNYLTRRGIEATIYTLRQKDGENKLLSAYKKYSRKPDTDRRLLAKFNSTYDTLLTINKGAWYTGDDTGLDSIKWMKGVQSFKKEGLPAVIDINKIIEPVPMKFEEVQGEMMTGYQDYLEQEWIKQLKGKYNVKVDSMVLEEVKSAMKNE